MMRFQPIAAAALFGLIAGPLAAQDRMMRGDCQTTVERIVELVAPSDPLSPAELSLIRVTPQGWCQMRGGEGVLEEAEFETLEWRADGVSRWTRDGIPPLGLQVRIYGLDPDDMQGSDDTRRPPVDVDITLRQDPDAGLVIVERAVMANDAGDSLAVSGVFERVFLSSPSMMQVSMGSATFKAGLMSMILEGTHENPFGFNGDVEMEGNPEAQFEAAFNTISSLPDGVIDDASRAELTAFASDLPKPVGTLEVSVASERGLGLMQIGMSMYSAFASVMADEPDALRREMEILFDGLTITADWSPAARTAD